MDRLRPGLVFALVALVGCFVAAATYKLAAPAKGEPGAVRTAVLAAAHHVRTSPTAAAFGRTFVRSLNGYAVSRGDSRRIANARCVQGGKGRYMCSYALVKPDGTSECHLMQATWTPRHPVTVMRAGRVARCDSLRAALKSLR